MDAILKIIEITVWPGTVIVLAIMLRQPLSELVLALKKLKYKDLELEFEKEAKNILAEAERDLPELKEVDIQEVRDQRMKYSRRQLEPSTAILQSWRELELKLRKIHGENSRKYSTGYLVRELTERGRMSKEISSAILALSSFRNKVAHTDEEIISMKAASSFEDSVALVISALESSPPNVRNLIANHI